jgi:hypothetical protein
MGSMTVMIRTSASAVAIDQRRCAIAGRAEGSSAAGFSVRD